MRYRLLESIWQYAVERLAESDDGTSIRRLAEHLTAMFTAAEESWLITQDVVWLACYEPELDNLRAGLNWAFAAGGGMRLWACCFLSRTSDLWLILSLVPERRRWLEMAPPGSTRRRRRTSPADPGGAGLFEHVRPAAAAGGGRGGGWRSSAASGIRHGSAGALHALGVALAGPGDVARAEPCFAEAEALLRPLGPSKALARMLDSVGTLHFFAGDFARARAAAEKPGARLSAGVAPRHRGDDDEPRRA